MPESCVDPADPANPVFLHFRKLRKCKGGDSVQELKAEIISLINGTHSTSRDIVKTFKYLYGRGQALVEICDTTSARDALRVLFEAGHEHISLGTARSRRDSFKQLPSSQNARLECERALAAVIRTLLTQDSRERCLARRLRKRSHNRLVEKTVSKHPAASTSADAPRYKRIFSLLGGPEALPGQEQPEQERGQRIGPLALSEGSLTASNRQELCTLISKLHTPLDRRLRRLICWESVRRGSSSSCTDEADASGSVSGSTSESCREQECNLLHVSRPVSELPATMRVFITEDSFTASSESAAVKEQVNTFVASRAALVLQEGGSNRCLVLDGKQCNTSRAVLRASPAGTRSSRDIIVPNYCSDTVSLIQSKHSDVCTGYFGSVRAFLDELHYSAALVEGESQDTKHQPSKSISKEPFGLVYLDYCCTFSCGYRSIEQSPREDLRALFSYGLLSDHAEIVLCVHVERVDKGQPDSLVLLELARLAEAGGFLLSAAQKRFAYGELEVFSAVVRRRDKVM